MSSFQASSTLYSPEYYKSGHSVDQNMYIVNTSHNYGHSGHKSGHTYDTVSRAHEKTSNQKLTEEQRQHQEHLARVQRSHEAMIHKNHGHQHHPKH